MRLKRSKKADAFRILNYGFWRLLFITLVFAAIAIYISALVNDKVDLYDLRSAIFAKRILTSNNGITFSSEYNNRNYPGIISLRNLENGALGTQFLNDTDEFSASILLENIQNNKQIEYFVNKKWFDRYYPLSKFDKYKGKLLWRYVLLKNQTLEKSRLLVKTVEKEQ
jgi:hypothetical protein